MMTATELRQDIYNIFDTAIKTAEPIVVERKGHLLKIVPMGEKNKVASLESHDVFNGDPDDLIHSDWSGIWSGKLP